MPRKAAPKPAKVQIDESQLTAGTLVLYRLKGYPPWPSMIVTEEHIPSSVKNAKPSSGGNVIPVRFFPFEKKEEYAWANPKGDEIIAIVSKEEIDAFVAAPKKGSSKGLIVAYQAAANPVDLDSLIVTEEDVVMEDAGEDEEEEEEAEDEDEDAVLEDVKDLYEDDEGEGTGKKRKRSATDDGQKSAKKKKPSVVSQPKKRTPKEKPNGESTPRERKKPGPKPKNKEADAAKEKAEEEANRKSVEEKRFEQKKKEMMFIRHKLQKTLLDKSGKEPDVKELPNVVDSLQLLTQFAGVTSSLLAETKIHRVLRRIEQLPRLPDEETYDIKPKAHEILRSWSSFIDEITEKKEADKQEASNGNAAASTETQPEPMEQVEMGQPAEQPKPEEPKPEEPKPAESKEGEAKTEAPPAPVPADPEEDFEIVESGVQSDELAQEKAVEKKDEVAPSSEAPPATEAVPALTAETTNAAPTETTSA